LFGFVLSFLVKGIKDQPEINATMVFQPYEVILEHTRCALIFFESTHELYHSLRRKQGLQTTKTGQAWEKQNNRVTVSDFVWEDFSLKSTKSPHYQGNPRTPQLQQPTQQQPNQKQGTQTTVQQQPH
jgi:hypothetical protein